MKQQPLRHHYGLGMLRLPKLSIGIAQRNLFECAGAGPHVQKPERGLESTSWFVKHVALPAKQNLPAVPSLDVVLCMMWPFRLSIGLIAGRVQQRITNRGRGARECRLKPFAKASSRARVRSTKAIRPAIELSLGGSAVSCASDVLQPAASVRAEFLERMFGSLSMLVRLVRV